MGQWKKFGKRTGAMLLSLAMVSSLLPADIMAQTVDRNTVEPDGVDTKITATEEDTRYWKLKWNDEFNSGALDSTKWTSMVGTGAGYAGDGWGNNELEYYTDGDNISFETTNADPSNTSLVLTAKKEEGREDIGGKSYTSARLWTMSDAYPGGEKTTKYATTYGRIEASIKIEGAKDGLWPAFWMMPADDVYGTWAASGEIDIFEARGREPDVVDGTIHYGSQWPNNKSRGGNFNSSSEGWDESFTIEEWHTYAVEWLPGEMRWYVDDNLYYSTSDWFASSDANATDYTYPAPFDEDFYILLNLAVGGNYDNGALASDLEEASMWVDYIRVYELADENFDKVAEYDESGLSKPTVDAPAEPISGDIGDNYVASPLADFAKTTSYPTESETKWFVSELVGGAATVSTATTDTADDTLKIDVTNAGTQDYAIQLIHNVPLTQGYRYVMKFDAKADSAKTLTAKFGNYQGWPSYSDTYEIPLTTAWQTYEYVFDMTEASDETARIEINSNWNAGANYFKNFSIVTTGPTPGESEDDAKAPLGDGNHIYNGTFDQGEGRTYYWHASANTTMSGSKATKDLQVVGTNASSGVYQKGINLLETDSYKLTFDAKSDAVENVTVNLKSADGLTTYKTDNISITANDDYDSYEMTFTMAEDTTDENAVIEFITGVGTVYLDNVKMIRTSNNNMDWSTVDIWPFYNHDFFNGKDGWNIWSETGGWTDSNVPALSINIDQGANFWCVGAKSPAMSLTNGVPYTITVDLTPSKNKTIKVETPDGVQTDYLFSSSGTKLEIPFTPTKDIPNGYVTLYFGSQSSTETGTFTCTINNIDVEIDQDKLELPADSKRPASVTSNGPVALDAPFVINHNDNTWASAITAAYINGERIDVSQINTSTSGKITFAANLVDDEGSYTITFKADGYCDTKPIAQNLLPEGGSVLVNGKFNQNLDGWTTYFAGENPSATGHAQWEDGEAVMYVDGNSDWGSYNWTHQLIQDNIAVAQQDYYLLSFDAYASVARPIEVETANIGGGQLNKVVYLTTEKKTYYLAYPNVTAASNAKLVFMTGNVDGCLDGFSIGAHSVYFDNVSLKPATQADIDALVAPTLSLKEQAILGNDVVLSYTENETWEGKSKTYLVNGEPIDSAKVTVNTTNKTVTIDASAFTAAGKTIIAIQAAGFADESDLKFSLVASEANLLTGDWATWVGQDDYAETGNVAVVDDYSVSVDFTNGIYHNEWSIWVFWTLQAKKDLIFTEAGKTYELSFDAELTYTDDQITADRDITIELGTGDDQRTVAISPGTGHYTLTVTPGSKADFYIQFMFGATEADVAAHNLTISNVTFADASKPKITQQPVGASYEHGDIVTALTVEAAGDVSYQWYKNTTQQYNGATAINGATEASYLPNLTGGTTYYYCKVTKTESGESVNSTIASITLSAVLPVFSTQPKANTYNENDTAEALTVAVNTPADNGIITYQWFSNTANSTSGATMISGATNAAYTPSTLTVGTVYYYCVATNTKDAATRTATSNIVAIAVEPNVIVLPDAAQAPNITKQPANATYTYGAAASDLSVTAAVTDGGTLSYQWYRNSKNSTTGAAAISGATKATYKPAVNAAGTTYYYCVVTNTNNQATITKQVTRNSNIVSVTVNKATNKITVQSSVTKVFGNKAFSLGATGKGTLTYKPADTKVVTVDKNGRVTIKGCGRTTITITAGDNNYQTVTSNVTITVKPKKATFSSLKSSKSKTATVRWQRDKTATGYEIQYSTNKNFKGAKSINVTKNSTTSRTISKLTGGKRYYVRVRAYKTSGKTRINGAWSTARNTTVKR